MLKKYSKQPHWHFENEMTHTLFIEIFDESWQNVFDDFAIDWVFMDEWWQLIDDGSDLLSVWVDCIGKLNDRLENRMVELHDLLVSFG